MAHQSNYLALSWSVSRGQDTFGYNICRLDDRATDKRYKCMGGGYDMVGANMGDWLEETFQAQLLKIKDRSHYIWSKEGTTISSEGTRLYGMTYDPTKSKVVIDGACGLESVKRIAEAIGVAITNNYNKRKERNEGFFVSWQE